MTKAIAAEDKAAYSPKTRVRIIAGTHKGKRGVIGEAKGTGRNSGKVQVTEVGRLNESYWILPSYLKVESPGQQSNQEENQSSGNLLGVCQLDLQPSTCVVGLEPVSLSPCSELTENFKYPQPLGQDGYLPLRLICTDGGTQARAGLNDPTVEEYAEAMEAGDNFPPVLVFHDGERYYLADGFHRVAAARRLGWADISITIKQGTRRDAILNSVGANATHGLRRTNADKRRAVETLLSDEEWSQWSNRAIAKQCGVSPAFVDKLRLEVEPPANDRQSDSTANGRQSRKGLDGRTMNTANIGGDKRDTSSDNGCQMKCPATHRGTVYITGTPSSGGDEREFNGEVSMIPTSEIDLPAQNGVYNEKEQVQRTRFLQEIHQQGKSLGLNTRGDRTLPEVDRNDAPSPVDDRPFAMPASTVIINIDEVYKAFVSNLDRMNHEHILAAVGAIATRTNPKAIELLDDESLERFINHAEALRLRAKKALNARRHPNYSNGTH